jgi:hypothetical protein
MGKEYVNGHRAATVFVVGSTVGAGWIRPGRFLADATRTKGLSMGAAPETRQIVRS